jgi:hypothetical protein
MRAALGQWSADALDVFLGRQPPDGQAARRAGLHAGSDDALEGANVLLIPPAGQRTTALLPIGGALGPQEGAAAPDDPLAGADAGVQQTVEGMTSLTCLAGSLVSPQDPALAPCARDITERPGDGPALYLRAGPDPGTWRATLPEPRAGTVLATIAVEPDRPPAQVVLRAGGAQRVLSGDDLAVPASDGDDADRTIPLQVRLVAQDPISEVVVELRGGGALLQDVVVVG